MFSSFGVLFFCVALSSDEPFVISILAVVLSGRGGPGPVAICF